MQLAIKLFLASVRDIIDEPLVALQVSGVLTLVLTFVGIHWFEQALAYQKGWLLFPGRFVWWMWALGLAGTVIPSLWMAVGWHRFVILGERPWLFLPRFRPGQTTNYGLKLLGAMIALVLMLLLASFVLGATVGVLRTLLGFKEPSSNWTNAVLYPVFGAILGTLIILRLSPAMVASACGEKVSLQQAWQATKSNDWSIVLVVLPLLGISLLFDYILRLLNLTGLVLGGYQLVSSWFLIMLNISILTTIHRHFVVAHLEAETSPAL